MLERARRIARSLEMGLIPLPLPPARPSRAAAVPAAAPSPPQSGPRSDPARPTAHCLGLIEADHP